MRFFSWFQHDPSKDDMKTAKKISLHEEEDRRAREEIEIERAKVLSLKEADEKRRLEESCRPCRPKKTKDESCGLQKRKKESNAKGKEKKVDDVNPPPPPPPVARDGTSVNPPPPPPPPCLCCFHCHKPIAMQEVPN